jgi:hypothetical protein
MLNFGHIDFEMVAGLGMVLRGHPERVVHSLDVGNFQGAFKEAIAVLPVTKIRATTS